MEINYKSKYWKNPKDKRLPAKFDFEQVFTDYEEYLVEQYLECQLHINSFSGNCDNSQWWDGNLKRIETNVVYLEQRFGIRFDKVFAIMKCLPHYNDMSENCKEIYRMLMGEP